MKLKYEQQARQDINGRKASNCLSFNWLGINKTCNPLDGTLHRCCMLDGKECPEYRGCRHEV